MEDDILKIIFTVNNDEAKNETKNEYEKIIIELFEKRDKITRRDIEKTTQMSKAHANRIINSMLEKGVIRSCGRGRSSYYVKNID